MTAASRRRATRLKGDIWVTPDFSRGDNDATISRLEDGTSL